MAFDSPYLETTPQFKPVNTPKWYYNLRQFTHLNNVYSAEALLAIYRQNEEILANQKRLLERYPVSEGSEDHG